MDKKSKIILVLLIITLLSLSSYASLSRFSKGINKEGSINTTEMEYCKLNEIDSFNECLIRNDSRQELSLALNTIEDRTSRVDFNKTEPINIYVSKTTYVNIADKTSMDNIASTVGASFSYVVESKLINSFDVNDTDIKKVTFDTTTGTYSYKGSIIGSINDVVTTEEDMANGIYKYTCLNTITNGNCTTLYLFTEESYLISGYYRFKEGYVYSYELTDTTSMNAGLYKGEDDYTINDSNYTYYYRGDVKNNWVSFGGFLWRIVKINGDGSFKLIYSGPLSSTHTGTDAQIGASSFGDTKSFNASTTDLFDSTKTVITTYANGRYGPTNVGYMYNPVKVITAYPNRDPNESLNLGTFPSFVNISNTADYYFFKNFNPQEDCFTGDGTDDDGACTLKCRKLGNDGEDDVDCVYSKWNTLATTEGNYDPSAPGSTATNYIYRKSETDGGYRYTCWSYGNAKKVNNLDGTTSIYITCPVVSEIIGTSKNYATNAKIKYHGLFSSDANSANTNVSDSKIKTIVENWYANNIYNKFDGNGNYLEDYISDGIFCNDRSSTDTAFPLANQDSYVFTPYYRNASVIKTPSFKCLNIDGTFNTNDAFTLKTSGTESRVASKGNGNNMLTYPVGLITVDEVVYAGGEYDTMNYKYYLYTGEPYWTMSPFYFAGYNSIAYVWYVYSRGTLYYYPPSSVHGVRPVINLKSDILYKGGNGTENNPYIIDINS